MSVQSKITGKFVLTTDHQVRSRIWDLLSPYRKLVRFEGPNQTQLEFAPNPGASSQDAMAIVITNLYLARVDILMEIWHKSLEDHLIEVEAISEELGWNLKAEILLPWLEDAIVHYVTKASDTHIRRMVENLPYGYNTDVLWKRWQEGLEGYQRLLGINPACTFLTKEEWQTKVAEAQKLVDFLEAEWRRLKDIAKIISELKTRAQAAYTRYEQRADETAAYDLLDGLSGAFTEAKLAITDVSEQLDAINFDDAAGQEAARELKKLVPLQ